MIWNAYMNIQYVSSQKLAFYLTKYIAKSEPSHVFNIKEGDKFRKHIVARRLSSMELMFLILGETICNSLCVITYFTTDSPIRRQKAICSISLFNENNDDVFWIIYIHKLGNYIIKRTISKLVKFQHLTLHNGELFFYQKLLLKIPCRNKEELLGNFSIYREHWLSFHSEFNEKLQEVTQDYLRSQQLKLNSQFYHILDSLINNLRSLFFSYKLELINIQFNSL